MVTVLMTEMVTFPGVPAALQHALVDAGGSKLHGKPHWTNLFPAHVRLNAPGAGGVTTKFKGHKIGAWPGMLMVTVMAVVPGPTIVPATGVWLHM